MKIEYDFEYDELSEIFVIKQLADDPTKEVIIGEAYTLETAHLFYAAPELLAELEAAVTWWDKVDGSLLLVKPVWVEYARKAIAKASA